MWEIIHLVSPGLHNLDVSGYFSLPELSGSPALGCSRGVLEKAGTAPTAPPENCWDLGVPPHSCVTDGERDVNAQPRVPTGMWGRTRAVGETWQGGRGQRGTAGDSGEPSPGTSRQQLCLRSFLPSISFCHLPVPPPAPPLHRRALFPASLPFLSNAGRENWCEIKKGISAHR